MNRDTLRKTVESLAAFPTRHTLSPYCREAAEWIADQYRLIPGLNVQVMEYLAPAGPRVPQEVVVPQVIATIPGRTERRVMVAGHFDSLNLAGTNGPTDVARVVANRAPGANDDASGVAVGLDCAAALANQQHENTLCFIAFSGEEQGLLGSKALAAEATNHNWTIDALLSNDTVGSSNNLHHQTNRDQIRVFSEESDTHQSRELARWMEWRIRGELEFGIKLVLRKDRFGRGGDHTPFNQAGFTAVRLIEVHEEYSRQHTPDDLPEHMDFDYLSKVAEVNRIVLNDLANAAAPPEQVRIQLDQSHDTTITWVPGGRANVQLYVRETTSATWQESRAVPDTGSHTEHRVNKDDHIFAIAAIGGIPVVAS